MAAREIEFIDRRGFAAPLWLPFATLIGMAALILVYDKNILSDPDSYWHIAIGQWILAHGFPTVDSFSSTFAGHPWIAKEWLSQMAFDAAFRLGGWPAVGTLAMATTALAFGLLALFLLERLAPLVVFALLAFAFYLAAGHILARPHALAFPIMVLWIGGLVRAVDRGRQPSYWLLPLMTLWANLHGGFTLGILLAGALGLDALASAPAAERRKVFFGWLKFGVLTLIAACITPYGPESALVTWRILGMGPALQLIGEWRPADFSHFGAVEMVLLLGGGLALRNGFKLPPVRILILLGLLHLALSASRNAELLALLAPLVLMAPLSDHLPPFLRAQDGTAPAPIRQGALLVSLALVLMPFVYAGAVKLDRRPSDAISPAAALAAAQANSHGVILNDYSFGGYMIANGVKTFIDGRTELYGGDFLMRYRRALALDDLPDLLAMLNQYKVEATLLAPSEPAVAFLDRAPGWRRVYSDANAVVHVRDLRPAQ